MPEVLEQIQTEKTLPRRAAESYTSTIYDGVYYPEERETDMGETSIHIKLIAYFLNALQFYFNDRQDVFVTANMNLYYVEGNPYKWFAPDLLIAFGVPKVERSSYLLFAEEVFPQVIIEVASEKTWRNDMVEKYELYDRLGAEEYYILDPETGNLPEPLTAYRREGIKLAKRRITGDRIFSPRLDLEIVRTGNAFRLFNPQKSEFLPTLEEAEALRKEREAEIERLKAEIERLKKRK